MNKKNCKEAVSKYVKKWPKAANVDIRVVEDWEQTIHESIDESVQSLSNGM